MRGDAGAFASRGEPGRRRAQQAERVHTISKREDVVVGATLMLFGLASLGVNRENEVMAGVR